MATAKLTRLFLCYCRGFAHPTKFRLITYISRWLLPKRGVVVTLAEGFDMRLQTVDHLERCLVVRGDYEPRTTRFIRANLSPGDVAAVAGANIGYYPLLLARAVGDTGRVLGVEPFPGNIVRCQDNLRLNPSLARSITLFAGALGRKSDCLCISSPPAEHSGLAQLSEDSSGGLFVKIEPLETITTRLLPRRPDLMLLDVEGWETEALAGFGAARPNILVIENDARHLATRRLTETDFFQTLTDLAYTLTHLDGRPASPGDFFPEQTLVAYQPGISPRWV